MWKQAYIVPVSTLGKNCVKILPSPQYKHCYTVLLFKSWNEWSQGGECAAYKVKLLYLHIKVASVQGGTH